MKRYRILTEEEARNVADKAREMSWTVGKARTPELTGTVKRNSEILQHKLLETIGKRLTSNPDVQIDCIPLKYHAPKFSRYAVGEYYRRHTDAPWMGETRTDLSCTMWLSGDYEGGELLIGGEAIKGNPGECVIYNCGEPHEVTPVTSGERICAITWIQSRVRCPIKRGLVSQMRRFLRNFEGDQELFVEGGQIHSALLRMWSET